MKSILLLATILAVGAAPALRPLDETALQQVIATNKGSVVLVSFWATWCEPCRAEMPNVIALESRLRAQGLKVIIVSADEPEQEADALRFVEAQHVPMPAYIKRAKSDQQFIDAVDKKWSGALPALFLYDRKGRRVSSWIGESDMRDVETAVRRALKNYSER